VPWLLYDYWRGLLWDSFMARASFFRNSNGYPTIIPARGVSKSLKKKLKVIAARFNQPRCQKRDMDILGIFKYWHEISRLCL